MRLIQIFIVLALTMLMITGCGSFLSDEEGTNEVLADVTNERTKLILLLIDEYQQCLKEACDDRQKAEACESYLEVAESLE